MNRGKINKEIIIEEAVKLLEEKGVNNFSLRSVAKSLGVKASSLYNHINNMEDLIYGVCNYSLELLNNEEIEAINGREKEEAIYALSLTYRKFAKEHKELYKVIMKIFTYNNQRIDEIGGKITIPFMKVLDLYNLENDEKAHWQRILRSILHGFVSQEEAGYFSHYPIDEETTFKYGVASFIDGLNSYIKRRIKNGNTTYPGKENI